MNQIFYLKGKLYFVLKILDFCVFHESANFKVYDVIHYCILENMFSVFSLECH